MLTFDSIVTVFSSEVEVEVEVELEVEVSTGSVKLLLKYTSTLDDPSFNATAMNLPYLEKLTEFCELMVIKVGDWIVPFLYW